MSFFEEDVQAFGDDDDWNDASAPAPAPIRPVASGTGRGLPIALPGSRKIAVPTQLQTATATHAGRRVPAAESGDGGDGGVKPSLSGRPLRVVTRATSAAGAAGGGGPGRPASPTASIGSSTALSSVLLPARRTLRDLLWMGESRAEKTARRKAAESSARAKKASTPAVDEDEYADAFDDSLSHGSRPSSARKRSRPGRAADDDDDGEDDDGTFHGDDDSYSGSAAGRRPPPRAASQSGSGAGGHADDFGDDFDMELFGHPLDMAPGGGGGQGDKNAVHVVSEKLQAEVAKFKAENAKARAAALAKKAKLRASLGLPPPRRGRRLTGPAGDAAAPDGDGDGDGHAVEDAVAKSAAAATRGKDGGSGSGTVEKTRGKGSAGGDSNDDDDDDSQPAPASSKFVLTDNGDVLYMDDEAGGGAADGEAEGVDVVETDMHEHRYITSASFKTTRRSEQWLPHETEAFFDALRKYGTDFTLISALFPTRTRVDIKRKYTKEQRLHPLLVEAAMRAPLPADLKELEPSVKKRAVIDRAMRRQEVKDKGLESPTDSDTESDASSAPGRRTTLKGAARLKGASSAKRDDALDAVPRASGGDGNLAGVLGKFGDDDDDDGALGINTTTKLITRGSGGGGGGGGGVGDASVPARAPTSGGATNSFPYDDDDGMGDWDELGDPYDRPVKRRPAEEPGEIVEVHGNGGSGSNAVATAADKAPSRRKGKKGAVAVKAHQPAPPPPPPQEPLVPLLQFGDDDVDLDVPVQATRLRSSKKA